MLIAAAVAAMLAASADAGSLSFVWPNPQMIEAIEVPGTLTTDGIPTRIKAFKTKLGILQLTPIYLDAFRKAKLYVTPPRHLKRLLREPTLSALDPKRLIGYTAAFQPNADGTTTVILGETNLGLRKAEGSEIAPLFPGAKDVLRTRQESADMLAYRAAAPERDVAAFYRETLPKAGWKESPEPAEEGVFRRGDDELTVLVRSDEPGIASVVVVRRKR